MNTFKHSTLSYKIGKVQILVFVIQYASTKGMKSPNQICSIAIIILFHTVIFSTTYVLHNRYLQFLAYAFANRTICKDIKIALNFHSSTIPQLRVFWLFLPQAQLQQPPSYWAVKIYKAPSLVCITINNAGKYTYHLPMLQHILSLLLKQKQLSCPPITTGNIYRNFNAQQLEIKRAHAKLG